MQVPRVARVRGLSVEEVQRLVVTTTQGPQAGTLGAPRVNVLALNMALDREITMSMPQDERPSPEAMLKAAQAEERDGSGGG